MPRPPLTRPCRIPRCPHDAEPRSALCTQHRNEQRRTADSTRPNAATRGYDARWQNTRTAYLTEHPRCQWPGCHRPATDVDHLDGLGPLAPRGHDWTNLRGLCHSHHSTRTNADHGGLGRTHATPLLPGSDRLTGENCKDTVGKEGAR